MADFFARNKGGVDDPRMHRMRRSEALLTQLYREEVSPRFQVPQIPGLKTMLIFSVLAMVFFSATLFYKFNAFILLREDVLTARGNLQAAIQRRSNLFGNMVKLTLNHAALEHSVFTQTADVRKEIIKKSKLPDALAEQINKALPPGALEAIESNPDFSQVLKSLAGDGELGASLGRLLAVVEQYPDIKSSETYKQMMVSLQEMEDRITDRRVMYNESLRYYNTAISKFPWYLLAELTDFDRLEYYSGDEGNKPQMAITPEIFQELLPLHKSWKKQQTGQGQ